MADIFSRIGVIDLLENAQKVCTAWRKICKTNPDIWRVIYLENYGGPTIMHVLRMICWEAVCRSQGQLVDLAMLDFCNDDFLFCLADKSSQLRSLDISCSSRYLGDISAESIQKVGRHCPMLETLKMNKAVVFGSQDWEEGRIYNDTAVGIAIGENMRELKHLELFGNNMLNDGLKAILDGCPHIESLDLRQCKYINLKGDLGERCSQQITYLQLPNDFVDSTPYDVTTDYYSYNDEYDDDDYNGDNDDYYNEDNGPLYSDSEEFVDYDNVADNDGDDDDFSNF
ncbi:F-box domain containing protein [Tanacetum coccineum]